MRVLWLILAAITAVAAPSAQADDWPLLGRDKTRNPVSPEKNPPLWWQVPSFEGKKRPAKNIRWHVATEVRSNGDPVVAAGMVWLGTQIRGANQELPTSVLACYREKDGKLLYQYRTTFDDRGGGFEALEAGHTSSPLIEGDRIWFTTPRCETVCLDIGPLKRGAGEPKIAWKADMAKDLGVSQSPAPMGYGKTCSPAVTYKDRLFICTGHGPKVDGTLPNPKAPSLVCFDKNSGKVLWTDNSPGKNIREGQWASPLVIEINGQGQVIAPQGDGWLRSFDAMTGELIWKFDANSFGADPKKFAQLIATPVYYDGKIYIGNGYQPWAAYPPSQLHFFCIDPRRKGDISPEVKGDDGKAKPNPNSGMVWRHGGFLGKRRVFSGTISAAAIRNGLVIVVDSDGYVSCLDAKTGVHYWRHDTFDETLGSPLIVDDCVYVACTSGEVIRLALDRDLIVQEVIDMDASTSSSPVFANGTLYLATSDQFYAIAGKEPRPDDVKKAPHQRRPDAYFVPTPNDIVDKMLALASVKKTDVVYDLGCGDGRIVVRAAKKFGCRAVGVDLDPDCVFKARDRVKKAAVEGLVTIEQKDLFTVDLADADVVALYLLPKLNTKLVPQLAKLKEGARIVSHTFPIPGYEPDQVVRQVSEEDGARHAIYVYWMPLRKAKE